jgi:hypothetical protein
MTPHITDDRNTQKINRILLIVFTGGPASSPMSSPIDETVGKGREKRQDLKSDSQ